MKRDEFCTKFYFSNVNGLSGYVSLLTNKTLAVTVRHEIDNVFSGKRSLLQSEPVEEPEPVKEPRHIKPLRLPVPGDPGPGPSFATDTLLKNKVSDYFIFTWPQFFKGLSGRYNLVGHYPEYDVCSAFMWLLSYVCSLSFRFKSLL